MVDWYLYLIRCRDGSLYTGITTDVTRRLTRHREEGAAGAKYLKGRGPLTLVFKKKLGSNSLALKVERRVKKLSKAKKEELVRTGKSISEMIKQINEDVPLF
ncbi:MAG: GIY-YIG nuclease family protein [Dehalococcoidales bacterium]|nr:GIY-YIG nuclease family protein [Dehalococcoidales bacterium]